MASSSSDTGPVKMNLSSSSPSSLMRARTVNGNREHTGALEAKRLELLAVVLGIAEREIHSARKRLELLTAERGQPEQPDVVRGKILRRRHVVVLQDAAAAERCEGVCHR